MSKSLSRSLEFGSGPWRRSLRTLLALRPFQVWAGLLLAVALACILQPLVGLLRLLGYELALLFAILGSVATIHVSGALLVRTREGFQTDLDRPGFAGDGLLVQLVVAILGGWALLLPPLVVGLCAALLVTNCDLLKGIWLWLALPVLSVPLAAVAGLMLGLAAPRRLGWLFVGIGAVVLVLTGILWELGRFYTTQIVFFFDAFGGYLSAQGWDRAMRLPTAYWWFRLFNYASFATLLLMALGLVDHDRLRLARPRPARWPLMLAAAATAFGAATLHVKRGELGFRPTPAFAAEEMEGMIETPHLTIIYDRDSLEDDASLVASDLEYRWDRLAEYFQRAPADRVRIWIYGSPEQKKRLFGTANTDMAKPWRNEVHLGPRPFPHPIAMHEMAHAFAGTMAGGPFNVPSDLGFHVSMGLVEGVAMAAEWSADAAGNDFTLHQWAAAMRLGGFAPKVERIVGAEGFLRSYPTTSYFLAGSFIRYLTDLYGIDAFARVYAGEPFPAVYGRDVAALGEEWGAFVDALPTSESAVEMARFRFDRPSILGAVCYRSIAELHEKAARLAGSGRFDEAVALQDRVCAYEPDRPSHLIAKYKTLFDARRWADARRVAGETLAHPKLREVERLATVELLADLDWMEGKLETAGLGYATVAAVHRSEPSDRRVAIKRTALSAGAEVRDGLREYFFPPRGRPPAVVLLALRELLDRAPESASLHYLLGFRLAGVDEWERAVPYLQRALELGLPHPALARETRWRLGLAWFRLGELEKAEAVFASLDSEGEPEAVRLTARDWLGRIAWWRANPTRACALGTPGCGRPRAS